MLNVLYILYVIVSLIVIIIQYIYIKNLKKGINYAIEVLTKYEKALLMDDIIRKVNEDESKADKTVSK